MGIQPNEDAGFNNHLKKGVAVYIQRTSGIKHLALVDEVSPNGVKAVWIEELKNKEVTQKIFFDLDALRLLNPVVYSTTFLNVFINVRTPKTLYAEVRKKYVVLENVTDAAVNIGQPTLIKTAANQTVAHKFRIGTVIGARTTLELLCYRDALTQMECTSEPRVQLVFKGSASDEEIGFTVPKIMREAVGLKGKPKGSDCVFDCSPKDFFMYYTAQYRPQKVRAEDYGVVFELIARHREDMKDFRRLLDMYLPNKLEQISAVTLIQIEANEKLYELSKEIVREIRSIMFRLSTDQLMSLRQDPDKTVADYAAELLAEKLKDGENQGSNNLPVDNDSTLSKGEADDTSEPPRKRKRNERENSAK